jgi:hypothetical protein
MKAEVVFVILEQSSAALPDRPEKAERADLAALGHFLSHH